MQRFDISKLVHWFSKGHKMNTQLIGLLLVSALVALSVIQVGACDSPSTEGTLGPMFGMAGTSSDEVPLLMATSNPNIIRGHVVSAHRDDQDSLINKAFNVTIDLSSGAVSDGWPVERAIAEPQTMEDPTLGYRLELRNTTVTLRSSTNSSHSAVDIELYAPSYAKVATHFLYFFVSAKLNRAYVFYVSEIDCSLPNGYRPCEQSPRGIFEEFWVSIVDVYTGRYFFQPFGRGFGVFLLDPGPHGSLQTVYDDVQVAMVSTNLGGRGCERSAYVFYDENAVLPTERFGKGLLAALQTNDRPRELSAFVIQQTTEELSRNEEDALVEEFVSEFVVNEVLVLTGEVLRQIPLNASDLYSLADFDPATFLRIAAVDSPTSSPANFLPTREPEQILEPTRAPVPALVTSLPTLSPTAGKPTVQAPFSLPPVTVPTAMIVGGEELVPSAPTRFASPFMWPPIPIGGEDEPSAPQHPSNGITVWTTAPVESSEPTTLAPTTIAPTTMTSSTALPTTISPTTKPTAEPTSGGMIVGGEELIPSAPTRFASPFMWPTIPISGEEDEPSAPEQPSSEITVWTTAPVESSEPTTVAPTTITPTTMTPSTALPTTISPTTVAPATSEPSTLQPTTTAPTTAKPTAEPTSGGTQPPLPEGFSLLTARPTANVRSWNVVPNQRPSAPSTLTPVTVTEQVVPIPDGFLLLTPSPSGEATGVQRTPYPAPTNTPEPVPEPTIPIPDGFLILTPKPIREAAGMERIPSPTPQIPANGREATPPPLFTSGLFFHLTAEPVGAPSSSNQLLRGQPTATPVATTTNSLADGQAQQTSSPVDLVIVAKTQQPTRAPVVLQPTYDLVISAEDTTVDTVLSPTRDPGIAAEDSITAVPIHNRVVEAQPLTPQPTGNPYGITLETSTKENGTTEEVAAATEPGTASSSRKRFSFGVSSILLAMTTLMAHGAF